MIEKKQSVADESSSAIQKKISDIDNGLAGLLTVPFVYAVCHRALSEYWWIVCLGLFAVALKIFISWKQVKKELVRQL